MPFNIGENDFQVAWNGKCLPKQAIVRRMHRITLEWVSRNAIEAQLFYSLRLKLFEGKTPSPYLRKFWFVVFTTTLSGYVLEILCLRGREKRVILASVTYHAVLKYAPKTRRIFFSKFLKIKKNSVPKKRHFFSNFYKIKKKNVPKKQILRPPHKLSPIFSRLSP